ncbi:hypothetical protein PENTCL1PPCAC_28711, partial [Pristionchus entomophagus]
MCNSTCFHEEQSTTPMKLFRCDFVRICHLQTTSDNPNFPTCNVVPFRRFVRTELNCKGQNTDPNHQYYKELPCHEGIITLWTNFTISVRTNLSRELGIDPCFPDPSMLHPELLNTSGVVPTCPKRKLDGSEGPVLFYR